MDTPNRIPFKRWLRARRAELDHDQDAAADHMDIGVSKLRRWEKGGFPSKFIDVMAVAKWSGLALAEVATMLAAEIGREADKAAE